MIGLIVTVERSGEQRALVTASRQLGDLRPWLEDTAEWLLRSAVERLQSRDTPGFQSGRLIRSLSEGGDGNIAEYGEHSVSVGSNLPYARKQHEGGTILPTPPRKALAIPINERLRTDGVYPRDLDPSRELLTLITDKDTGRAYLVAKDEIPGYGTGVMYRLVSSVTLPPRPYLLIDDVDAREIGAMLEEHLEEGN